MRRHAVLITLLASNIAVTALALLFHLWVRVSVLAAFEEYGTPMPATTQVALSGWLLPCAIAAAMGLSLVAVAAPLRRSQRHGLLGVGVVIASTALVFAVWAAFAPIFQPA